jgi:RPA family protein
MLQEYYANKETLDDPKQGRIKIKFQDETFRNPTPYETKEETLHRLKRIDKTEEEKKLYEETRKLNVWVTKTQEVEDKFDFEPKLQFEPNNKNGRKRKAV